MGTKKTEYGTIAAGKLAFGDEFKLYPAQKKWQLVQWTQLMQVGPFAGKIMVMTKEERPLFLDTDRQLIHHSQAIKPIPEVLTSRLPKNLEQMTEDELKQKLTLRTQQLCQNTELSSHLVDLLQQEVIVIQEELQERKSKPFHQVFVYAQKLDKLMEKDVKDEGIGITPKHERAKALLARLLTKAQSDAAYAANCLMWMEEGGASLLKHTLLSPLAYDDNNLTDFDAFVLIDDLGIFLREANKAKRKAQRQALRKKAKKAESYNDVARKEASHG